MKLIQVTHNVARNDGQGRVVLEIVRYALQAGMRVDIYADRIDPEVEDLGAVWYPVRPRRRTVNLVKVSEFASLAKARLRSCDRSACIVHAHGFTLYGDHHVNTSHMVHGAWLRSPYYSARSPRMLREIYHRIYTVLNARWEKRTYGNARVCVAVSDLVAEQLNRVGVDKRKIQVVHNGVDLKEFAPGPESRSELGLPETVPLLLFAGDIKTPLKNLETVLRVMPDLANVHLAVAGSPEGSPYPEYARKLGIANRVSFLGFRRDLPRLMRASDVFVFPSRYESFSLVLLEALACGTPVVTSRTVGASALITDDCGAVLASPDDSEGLAARLRALLADRTQLTKMGRNARQVAEQYSWAEMGRKYVEIFSEIASNISRREAR